MTFREQISEYKQRGFYGCNNSGGHNAVGGSPRSIGKTSSNWIEHQETDFRICQHLPIGWTELFVHVIAPVVRPIHVLVACFCFENFVQIWFIWIELGGDNIPNSPDKPNIFNLTCSRVSFRDFMFTSLQRITTPASSSRDQNWSPKWRSRFHPWKAPL